MMLGNMRELGCGYAIRERVRGRLLIWAASLAYLF
jgi:hypothetical protein